MKDAFERYINEVSAIIHSVLALGSLLTKSQVNAPKVQYDYFDFHRECKNMRWDRIDLLLNRIKDDLVDKAYVVSSNHFA